MSVIKPGERNAVHYYPLKTRLHNLLGTIDSPQTGILRSVVLAELDSMMPKIFSIAGDLADIHRLFGLDMDIQYHVGGYGIFYEEALIRVMSEALERYCIMLYPNLVRDDIIYATYNDLRRNGEELPPFEYFQLFTDSDYLRKSFPFHKPSPDQIIGWIRAQSLFNPNAELLIPAQVVLPGYRINLEKGEKQWAPGFSTGAASNINYESALLAALIEIVEIDAFGTHWFAQRPSPRISFEGTILQEIVESTMDTSILEPILLYSTLPDINIHTITTFIVNRKRALPSITCGCQASLDPLHCSYRSLAEATAVTLLGMSGYVYQPMIFLGGVDQTSIKDLDSNVAFYGEPKNYDLGTGIIRKLTSGESIHLDDLSRLSAGSVKDDISHVLKEINKVSQYAAVLDVTTPDVASLGFRVVKAYIPELMYMSLPSYPFTNHPRMRKYGGVTNEHPHPLP